MTRVAAAGSATRSRSGLEHVARAVVVLVGVVVAPGCQWVEAWREGPELARVGERRVSVADLERALQTMASPGELPESGAGFEAVRDHALRELLLGALLEREAEQRSMRVDDEAVEDEAAEILAGRGSPLRWENDVVARFGSVATWKVALRERLLWSRAEAAIRADLGDGVEIPKEQVEAALERVGAAAPTAGRVCVRQLYFDDEAAAREARVQIAGGASFAEVVRARHGSDGEPHWMTLPSIPWEMEAALEGMEPGEVSEVWASPLGWHLVELVDREAPSPPPPEAQLSLAEDLLREEVIDARFRAWVGARADEVPILIHDAALGAVRCCRQGSPYLDRSTP